MKEEEVEENDSGTDTKNCLASETHAFEKKFIKTYESLPVLWDATHSDYTNKYRRGIASDALVKIMKKWDKSATRTTVRRKINGLRSCYRKDLRRHLKSKTIGPDGEDVYEYIPKSWKFYALRFLGGKIDEKCLKDVVEVNLDSTNFDADDSEEIEDEANSSHTSDVLQTDDHPDVITIETETVDRKNKRRRVKPEVQEYYVEDSLFDKEIEAISSNVACKLKRMNPGQRCYAELLINKVLIGGLKNSLTDDTDLTEVYK